MKRIVTLFASVVASATFSFAQIGATAPDFTVTDLDGNTHNLYDILNSGRVVVLDCSATWCGPCWSFHGGHYLQNLHDQYGPAGTDQLRVIFYEADAATTLADLQGTGGSTQGDWLTGSTYPFINESPLTLSGSIFWPLGFPTINVISPDDKKIKADLYDPWSIGGGLPEMVDIIDDYWSPLGVEENTLAVQASVYPNPAKGDVTVKVSAQTEGDVTIEIANLQGQLVSSSNGVVGTNNINVSELESGMYIVTVRSTDAVATANLQIAQ